MSYILDALRKSDAQRRRGATPALTTPQVSEAAPARSGSLRYGVLAAVLLAAGIVIGALGPWQGEPPAPPREIVAAKPPEPSAPVPAPEPRAAAPKAQAPVPAPPPQSPPAAQPAPAPEAAESKRQARAQARAEAKARAKERKRETVAAVPEKAPAPAAADAPGARAQGAAQNERVVLFSELPLAIQQEMPPLSITAHAYSPVPRERLVGINDRVLREGESVTPSLVLEQITLEGMILNYKGYRFRRGAR